MRKLTLFWIVVLFSSVMPAAHAACANQFTATFHQWNSAPDTALTVPNPGVFNTGAMPTCAWHYTQPIDLTTELPAGTTTGVQNTALGSTAQGGFTFMPNPGYVGTAVVYAVSDDGEFQQQASFVVVSAGGGSGGGTTPTDKAACKKGGWMSLTRPGGAPFKNEGDCVSWVTNGK